jgi:uncharacterized protein with HEPN domain
MKNDKIYLRHILDAVADIEKFINGVSEEDFSKNREKQYAILRALEIIGEASKNLSDELKAKCPDIDWKNIAGMRDKLIHAYFGVNLPLVWGTVKNDLPQLKKQTQNLLKDLNNTS